MKRQHPVQWGLFVVRANGKPYIFTLLVTSCTLLRMPGAMGPRQDASMCSSWIPEDAASFLHLTRMQGELSDVCMNLCISGPICTVVQCLCRNLISLTSHVHLQFWHRFPYSNLCEVIKWSITQSCIAVFGFSFWETTFILLYLAMPAGFDLSGITLQNMFSCYSFQIWNLQPKMIFSNSWWNEDWVTLVKDVSVNLVEMP